MLLESLYMEIEIGGDIGMWDDDEPKVELAEILDLQKNKDSKNKNKFRKQEEWERWQKKKSK